MGMKLDWRRLFVEGTLIVVSILIAFAIDALWEKRGVRVAETRALEQIEADFRGYQGVIARRAATHRSRRDAARELLALTGPQAESTREVIDPLLRTVWTFNEVTFSPGALETLLSSDGLTLLRDPELRALIAQWLYSKDQVAVVNEFTVTQVLRLGEYITPRYPFGPAEASDDGPDDRAPSAFPRDATSLLRDLEFENLIHAQFNGARAMVSRLDSLEVRVSHILGSLQGR